MPVLYAVSIRQTSALPLASFRFHLTMDTLAIKLTIPLAGFVKNFHLLAGVRYWAYQQKKPRTNVRGFNIINKNYGATNNVTGNPLSTISISSIQRSNPLPPVGTSSALK